MSALPESLIFQERSGINRNLDDVVDDDAALRFISLLRRDESLRNRRQQICCQFWIQCLQNVVLLHRAGLFAGSDIIYAQGMLREDIPGFDLDNFAQQLDRFLWAVLF